MAIKDFEMRVKNTDGSYDILHPITKAKNVLGLDEKVIVESGENSNGKFVKFGNGTVVAYLLNQQLEYSTSKLMKFAWVFPCAFIEEPAVFPGSKIAALSARGDYTLATFYGTKERITVIAHSTNNVFEERSDAAVDLYAIGRWK